MIYRIRICISGCTIARLHLATSSHILIMIYIVILIYIYISRRCDYCWTGSGLQLSVGLGFGVFIRCWLRVCNILQPPGFLQHKGYLLGYLWDKIFVYGLYMVLNYISKNGLCNRDNRLRWQWDINRQWNIPSGNLTMDFPIENGDFP